MDVTDESGSDSEGGGSSSSSYSSLSDMVSEMAPDVSPATTAALVQTIPMTLSCGLDLKAVYQPPSTLQLPGGVVAPGLEMNEASSQHESMSSSSSQSSIGSSHGIQKDLTEDHVTGRSEVSFYFINSN